MTPTVPALALVATRHGSTTRLPAPPPVGGDPRGAVEARSLAATPCRTRGPSPPLLADGPLGLLPLPHAESSPPSSRTAARASTLRRGRAHVDSRGRSWWRTLRASEVRAVREGTPLPAGVWTVYNRTRPGDRHRRNGDGSV